jgi:hypothetical protein
VCYQIESHDFDVEHLLQNGDESVNFQNTDPYVATAYLQDGVVNKVTIEAHSAKGNQS